MSTDVMNYDPNLTLCGRMATQQVKLVFGQWEARAEMTVEVGGNCRGHTVIECAVGIAYDQLPKSKDRYKLTEITLVNPDGSFMQCEDDKDECEDWLKEMLLSAEILSITPDNADEPQERTETRNEVRSLLNRR